MAPTHLLGLLDRNAHRHPREPALAGRRGGVGWSLSWSGLRTRVLLGAAHLRDAGVEPGDTVAVWAREGPRRLVAALSLQARGAAEVPLAPGLPRDQARFVLRKADPFAALAETEAGRRRRVLGEAGVEAVLDPGELPDPARPAPEAPDEEAADGRRDGPALVFPVGWGEDTRLVPVTRRELLRGVQAAAEALPLVRGDRVLQAAPATHVPARVAGTLAPLATGAAVAPIAAAGDPAGRAAGEDLLEAAGTLDATALSVASDGAAGVWRAAGRRTIPLDRVLAAGDPLPEEAREGLEAGGVEVVEVHGPAETGPVVAFGPRRRGTLAPVPGMETRTEGGSLRIRGPGAPEAASDDGWMATGWRATVTDAGRVRPRGRAADALEAGGETVAAETVEAALRGASPAVARAVAFPVDGEPGAVLVPDHGEEGDGGGEGKRRERLLEAARRADPGPRRVLVRGDPPSLEAGLRDNALEVRRRACAEAWAGEDGWSPV